MRAMLKDVLILIAAGVAPGGCDRPPPSVATTDFQDRKEGYAVGLEAQAIDAADSLEREAQSLHEAAESADGATAERYRDRAEASDAAAADVLEDGFAQADEQRAQASKLGQLNGR